MRKLLALSCVLLPLVSKGATVTGSIQNSIGNASNPYVIFTPTSTPQFINGVLIVSSTVKATPTNGLFSILLVGGQYNVSFPGFSPDICIFVPYNDLNTYTLQYVNSLCQAINSGSSTNVPIIISFTNSVGSAEFGSTNCGVILGWTLGNNTPITSQTLDNGIGSIDPTLRAWTDTNCITSNRIYTLTVGNGVTNTSATTPITFFNKRYWGVGSSLTPSDAQLIAMNSQLASDRFFTATLSPVNQHMTWAFPTNFGTPTFIFVALGSPDLQFFPPVTRVFTNDLGFKWGYNIYVGSNVNNGTFTYQVQ